MNILQWTATGSATVTQGSGQDTIILFTPDVAKVTYTSMQHVSNTSQSYLHQVSISVLSVTLIIGVLAFKKLLSYNRVSTY